MGMRLFYLKKIDFWPFYCKKKHFFDFFQKRRPFLNFFIFLLIGNIVKLNADSKFLVHFFVGPHLKGGFDHFN
jgi:hypothetical protein